MSLARRHYERTVAARAADPAATGQLRVHANSYELMLAQLAEDRRRLKAIQSVERKIDLKRQLLPRYEPWVTGTLEGGKGAQDDVLVTAMVWHIDVGEFPRALEIAAYVLAHGLTLPDQYKRDAGTLIAEEIAERALAAIAAGEAFDIHVLEATVELTADRDMPDEARAKLHKALGLRLAAERPSEALDHLRRALSLHERVGVKKDIERLERELKKAGPPG